MLADAFPAENLGGQWPSTGGREDDLDSWRQAVPLARGRQVAQYGHHLTRPGAGGADFLDTVCMGPVPAMRVPQDRGEDIAREDVPEASPSAALGWIGFEGSQKWRLQR